MRFQTKNISVMGYALAFLEFLTPLAASSPVLEQRKPAALPLPHRLVTQFPNGTWVENIAVRENGDLLVTILSPSASLYSISNPTSGEPKTDLIHTFDSINGLVGLTEVKKDKFVVVGGTSSQVGVPVPGTFSAWNVNFQHGKTTIKLITAMPEATFPNGVEVFSECQDIVLISDSTEGLVWRLNTKTGAYDVSAQVPEMAIPAGSALQIGINGIKVFRGYLYWSNSFEATIYRLKLNARGYAAKGAKVQTVAVVDAIFIDDFTINSAGIIWAETNLDNQVIAIQPFGESVVVEGAPTELTVAGDTAAAFGRLKADKKILYVSTSGAEGSPVNGTITEGGKVVAVDTTGFKF